MWTRLSHSRLFQLIAGLSLLVLVVFLLVSFIRKGEAGMTPSPTVSFPDVGVIPSTTNTNPGLMTSTMDVPEMAATPTSNSTAGSICAEAWGMEIKQPLPGWLQTPASAEGLHTVVKYSILAGQLISNGIVDATGCYDGGLTRDGTANTCGMEKAYPQVITWQNQFDDEILQAANDNRIPAQVIKRLFAQETQFWPPNTLAPATYGIGNVTSPGIEPLFLWYEDIYQETCQGLSITDCYQPYHSLSLQEQQALRGYLISQYMHAYCPTCPYRIDLEKMGRSIDYFVKLIAANCYQTGRVLSNHGFSTSSLAYEDAWRLTLANYTVGVGCVSNAIEGMQVSDGFSWESFTEGLSPECYVDIYISRITGE